jgi:hypothetical protein
MRTTRFDSRADPLFLIVSGYGRRACNVIANLDLDAPVQIINGRLTET